MTATLEQIKAHPAFPFVRFREDEPQYMMVELYWLELWKTVLGPVSAEYVAWLEPDGAQEGNPIFSALHEPPSRGVVIKSKWMEEGQSHWRGGGRYFPFQPYVARYPVGTEGPEPSVMTLVMLADVSAEAEQHVSEFLRAFCVERVSWEELEAKCAAYESAVGM